MNAIDQLDLAEIKANPQTRREELLCMALAESDQSAEVAELADQISSLENEVGSLEDQISSLENTIEELR